MAIKPLVQSIPFRPDSGRVIGFRTNLPSVDLPGVRQLSRTMEAIGVQEAKEGAERSAKELAFSTPIERDPETGSLKMPEPPSSYGTYARDVFADLVRKRYIDSAEVDLKTNLVKIASENLDNPDEALRKSQESILAASKALDPRVAPLVAERANKIATELAASNLRRNALIQQTAVFNDAVKSHAKKATEAEEAYAAGNFNQGDLLVEEMKRLYEPLIKTGKIGPEQAELVRRTYDMLPKWGRIRFEIGKAIAADGVDKRKSIELIRKVQSALFDPTFNNESIVGTYTGKDLYDMADEYKQVLVRQLNTSKSQLRGVGGRDENGMSEEELKNYQERIKRATAGNVDSLPQPSIKSAQKQILASAKDGKVSPIASADFLGLGSHLETMYKAEVDAAANSAENAERVYKTYMEAKSYPKTKNFADAIVGGTNGTFARDYNSYRNQGRDSNSAFLAATKRQEERIAKPAIAEMKKRISEGLNGSPSFSDIETASQKQFGQKKWAVLSINARKDFYESLERVSNDKRKTIDDAAKEAMVEWKRTWIANPYALKGATRKETGLPAVIKDGQPNFGYLDSMLETLPKYLPKEPDGKVRLNGSTSPVDPASLRMGKNVFVQKVAGVQQWRVFYFPEGGAPSQIMVNNGNTPLIINPTKIVKKENAAIRSAEIQNARDLVNKSWKPTLPVWGALERKARSIISSPLIQPARVLGKDTPDDDLLRFGLGTYPTSAIKKAIKKPVVEFFSRNSNLDASEVSVNPLTLGGQEAKKLMISSEKKKKIELRVKSLDEPPKIPFTEWKPAPDFDRNPPPNIPFGEWKSAPQIDYNAPPAIPMELKPAKKLDKASTEKLKTKILTEEAQGFKK